MDTKELRRLAKAATPGPWECVDAGHKYVVSKSGEGYISREVCKLDGSTMSAFRQKENGPFIAAANPTTIEVLLDRLEAAEQIVQDYLRIDGEKSLLAQRLEAAEKERDVLRLEIRVVRQERDHANQRYSSALRLLTGIHAVLYPPSFTDQDGRTWQYKTPLVEEQLQELSDHIRGLLDEIAHAALEELK